ncbi:hypothetical protein ANCCAN_18407 [Ancylostoma caninum]|uniref:Uncharacterized protein n=1 Tax=Ancylostoma caninum TaxID=29170 RepID=A0A368FU68_ANCCA|nr:hypothetical protein ANCCAN_18407 [Ancylostoma caninum]
MPITTVAPKVTTPPITTEAPAFTPPVTTKAPAFTPTSTSITEKATTSVSPCIPPPVHQKRVEPKVDQMPKTTAVPTTTATKTTTPLPTTRKIITAPTPALQSKSTTQPSMLQPKLEALPQRVLR